VIGNAVNVYQQQEFNEKIKIAKICPEKEISKLYIGLVIEISAHH